MRTGAEQVSEEGEMTNASHQESCGVCHLAPSACAAPIELRTEEPQRNRVNTWQLYWVHATDLDANYKATPTTLQQAGFVPEQRVKAWDRAAIVTAIKAMSEPERTLLLIDVVEDSSALGQVRGQLAAAQAELARYQSPSRDADRPDLEALAAARKRLSYGSPIPDAQVVFAALDYYQAELAREYAARGEEIRRGEAALTEARAGLERSVSIDAAHAELDHALQELRRAQSELERSNGELERAKVREELLKDHAEHMIGYLMLSDEADKKRALVAARDVMLVYEKLRASSTVEARPTEPYECNCPAPYKDAVHDLTCPEHLKRFPEDAPPDPHIQTSPFPEVAKASVEAKCKYCNRIGCESERYRDDSRLLRMCRHAVQLERDFLANRVGRLESALKESAKPAEPYHCAKCGASPFEPCDKSVIHLDPEPAAGPSMFSGEERAAAWAAALKLLEEAGEDVPALLRAAADNVEKHGHGNHVFPAAFPKDDPAPCWCHKCNKPDPLSFSTRMILCPTCGNKRCPRASDHDLACTGSNASGQPGSVHAAPLRSAPPPCGKCGAVDGQCAIRGCLTMAEREQDSGQHRGISDVDKPSPAPSASIEGEATPSNPTGTTAGNVTKPYDDTGSAPCVVGPDAGRATVAAEEATGKADYCPRCDTRAYDGGTHHDCGEPLIKQPHVDALCACGHRYGVHSRGTRGACTELSCLCPQWADPPAKPELPGGLGPVDELRSQLVAALRKWCVLPNDELCWEEAMLKLADELERAK
jgi:hypothetical protein